MINLQKASKRLTTHPLPGRSVKHKGYEGTPRGEFKHISDFRG